MDFDVNEWVNDLAEKLKNVFAQRLLFVGLQGSYRRGEAKPTSDIDIVVILDKLSIDDLKAYKRIISSMPEKEKACGFISGQKELKNWPKMDIFQFQHDTKPVFGTLNNLVPLIKKQDIKDYIKTSSANLYHMAVHSYLYDDNYDNFKAIKKSLLFLFQTIVYLDTGKYFATNKELVNILTKEQKEMLEVNIDGLSESELEKYCNKLIKYLSKEFCY